MFKFYGQVQWVRGTSMVCEPESMADAATIIYLIALKMARRVGQRTQEERALRIFCQKPMSGYYRDGGRRRQKPSVERPFIDTWR